MGDSRQREPSSQAFTGVPPGDWFRFLQGELRHLWEGQDRLHMQVRAPQPGSSTEAQLAESVREMFESRDGVHWARYNAHTRRVVIDREAGTGDPHDWVARLEELEARLGLLDTSLGGPAGSSGHHPADLEPILQELVELALELAGGAVGLVLQGPGGGAPARH